MIKHQVEPVTHFFKYEWKTGELDALKQVLTFVGAPPILRESEVLPHPSDLHLIKDFYRTRTQNAQILELKEKGEEYRTRMEELQLKLDAITQTHEVKHPTLKKMQIVKKAKVGHVEEFNKLTLDIDQLRRSVQHNESVVKDRMVNKWSTLVGDDIAMEYPDPLRYEPFRLNCLTYSATNIIKGTIRVSGTCISFLTDADTIVTTSTGAALNNTTRDHTFYSNVNIQKESIAGVVYELCVPTPADLYLPAL